MIKCTFSIMLIALLLLAGLFIYARFIEPELLVEKQIVISSSNVSVPANHLKIAVFSDTHFSEYYRPEDFQKSLDSLASQKPDLVLFCGDLFDNFDTYARDVSRVKEALAGIEAPLGKYAIFGNHDYGGGAENEYTGILSAGGFTVLNNQYFPLEDQQIGLIGLDDFMLGEGNLEKTSWARPDYFNIVICHEPDIIDAMLDTNIDLMVAGHTHGGQINLPGYEKNFLPPYGEKYIYGLYEFSNARTAKLYVNPGLGTTQIPLRFRARPEITYITLANPNL